MADLAKTLREIHEQQELSSQNLTLLSIQHRDARQKNSGYSGC